ncbi:max dimerization protein 3 isoform X3 [Python bivittatus]|uniref:Max dimerization protein 3 n=1 Tax=Python bivittatus TaxID=176946 RepID=A0A9F5MS73_PYTBI|nr:max dimerization protein 3 isoform X3 [Python bivittatus]
MQRWLPEPKIGKGAEGLESDDSKTKASKPLSFILACALSEVSYILHYEEIIWNSTHIEERSVHNDLEKHRRAQVRQCLEQLKQQIPTNTEHSRCTMLSLLHQARLHIKKLEHQEQKAQQVKERLRREQQNLHQRLEELQGHMNMEHTRADSLDCSQFSFERSDSEDAEVDVEGLVPTSIGEDVMAAFSTQQEHSYSNVSNFWLWTEVQLGGQLSSRQASSLSTILSWQSN